MNKYVLLVMPIMTSLAFFSQGPNDTGSYYQGVFAGKKDKKQENYNIGG